jgi:hypothetical protein
MWMFANCREGMDIFGVGNWIFIFQISLCLNVPQFFLLRESASRN